MLINGEYMENEIRTNWCPLLYNATLLSLGLYLGSDSFGTRRYLFIHSFTHSLIHSFTQKIVIHSFHSISTKYLLQIRNYSRYWGYNLE